MKLEISCKKKNGYGFFHMDMKQHATNKNQKNNESMKKSKRKSENTVRQMKMETQHLRNL